MLKKSLTVLTISLLLVGSLSACTQRTALTPVVPQVNGVQSQSLTGIYKQIGTEVEKAFKALDKNNDKKIIPSEFGVQFPEEFIAFRELDDNKDGQLVKDEMTPGFFGKASLTLKLKSAADSVFKLIDKNNDKYLVATELESDLISTAVFKEIFSKFDKETGKNEKNKLSRSEFENAYAYVALRRLFDIPVDTAAAAAPTTPTAPVTTAPATTTPAAK